jgi:NhaA family Na+:H+ antiporter
MTQNTMQNKKNKIDWDTIAAFTMIFSAFAALVLSNSTYANLYYEFINFPLNFGYNEYSISYSIAGWVKELLMVFFFLNITLELKKEFYEGFLTDKKQFILPLIATIGGMVFPALFYIIINYNYPENSSGFAIPCATDIAFAMCIFNLLGKKLSGSIKIFLLSIAIFDDLGSMVLIALFYNHKLSIAPLLIAALIIGFMFILHKIRIISYTPYLLLGALLWFAFHSAGIHTTMAGVFLGAFIPMYSNLNKTHSPLTNLNKAIHPWVQFLVLPAFSFVASGVTFSHLKFVDLLNPISLGIIVGLFLGKQVGIYLSTWIAVKSKLSPLPAESNWFEIYFAACLAGIGFTMSLFIGSLAFEDTGAQDLVKIGILFSSLITVIYSFIVIKFFSPNIKA